MRGATDVAKGGGEVKKFQPTRPLRGATCFGAVILRMLINFNPRAPCGARLSSLLPSGAYTDFNPRAPCGARLYDPSPLFWSYYISTHAPLAGRDPAPSVTGAINILYFNPRAPCGARLFPFLFLSFCNSYFNPRAPCGARLSSGISRATLILISTHAPLAGRDAHRAGAGREEVKISTHAPLAGRDIGKGLEMLNDPDFNPRAPCGARPFSPVLIRLYL